MKGLLLAVAIVHATVFTGEGPPIEDATVLIRDEEVVSVGRRLSVPPNAEVIDAGGQWVTPGLIDPASRLGLVDVDLEPSAVEGTAGDVEDAVQAALRTADTFNGASLAIPVARGGGVTSTVAIPSGGIVSGQSSFVDLIDAGPMVRPRVALHVDVRGGRSQPGSLGAPIGGARSRAFMRVREALQDAELARSNAAAYSRRTLRELSVSPADVAVLERAVSRDLPVVFSVDRATDIRTVLDLASEHRLRAILLGAAEGWKVAHEIAAARVPVLVDPLRNLPATFDSLEARDDNAVQLHRAGVKVAFTQGGEVHRVHRLRWLAGNAVARGMSHEHALEAITRVPAEIFGVADRGVLRRGAIANVVIWSGDPLEVTSWPLRILMRGQEIPVHSRQDALTERYR